MAREWIKWIKGLEGKREVVAMAIRLRPTGTLVLDCEIIAAKWMKVWSWADSETADGHVGGVSADYVDAVAGLSGFFAAAEVVGWAWSKDHGVSFVNWGRHNGESGKARAVEQAKKARQRHTPHVCPDAVPMASGQERDQRREEKRREEKGEERVHAPAGSLSRAPFDQVFDEYPPNKRPSATHARLFWYRENLDQHAPAILEALRVAKSDPKWVKTYAPRIDRWLEGRPWEAPQAAPEDPRAKRDGESDAEYSLRILKMGEAHAV